MKTKEEQHALKEEYENMSKKLAELSEHELKQVVGGLDNEHLNFYDKIGENPDGRVVYVM